MVAAVGADADDVQSIRVASGWREKQQPLAAHLSDHFQAAAAALQTPHLSAHLLRPGLSDVPSEHNHRGWRLRHTNICSFKVKNNNANDNNNRRPEIAPGHGRSYV